VGCRYGLQLQHDRAREKKIEQRSTWPLGPLSTWLCVCVSRVQTDTRRDSDLLWNRELACMVYKSNTQRWRPSGRHLWCGVAVYDMLHQRIDELYSPIVLDGSRLVAGAVFKMKCWVVGQKTLRYGVSGPFLWGFLVCSRNRTVFSVLRWEIRLRYSAAGTSAVSVLAYEYISGINGEYF
jgi:hypothetical protein